MHVYEDMVTFTVTSFVTVRINKMSFDECQPAKYNKNPLDYFS